MENGVFLEDFDDALGNLYNDSVFAARLASVQTNRGSAAGSMSGLKDAPEGYEDVYQALKEQYDAYIKLTNLALQRLGGSPQPIRIPHSVKLTGQAVGGGTGGSQLDLHLCQRIHDGFPTAKRRS
mgnify:CR=1 FL=1